MKNNKIKQRNLDLCFKKDKLLQEFLRHIEISRSNFSGINPGLLLFWVKNDLIGTITGEFLICPYVDTTNIISVSCIFSNKISQSVQDLKGVSGKVELEFYDLKNISAGTIQIETVEQEGINDDSDTEYNDNWAPGDKTIGHHDIAYTSKSPIIYDSAREQLARTKIIKSCLRNIKNYKCNQT